MSLPSTTCILDIGSANISAAIADVNAEDKIEVMSFAHRKSCGVKNGKVYDMDKTVACIKQVIEEVERISEHKVHSVLLTVASRDIVAMNESAGAGVADVYITKETLNVCYKKLEQRMPNSQQIIHSVLQGVFIGKGDDEEFINQPIDIVADYIQSRYHVLTMPKSMIENLDLTVHKKSLINQEILPANIAGSYFGLTDNEREKGMCHIDIGAHTTSVAVYFGGVLAHSGFIAIGGADVTKDIATEHNMSFEQAERIKLSSGNLVFDTEDLATVISVPAYGSSVSSAVSAKVVNEVITARYYEIITLVLQDLYEADLIDIIKNGIVCSGGGAQIKGFAAYMSEATKERVSLANFPKNVVTKQIDLLPRFQSYPFHGVCGALIYHQKIYLQEQKELQKNALSNSIFKKYIFKPFERFSKIFSRFL